MKNIISKFKEKIMERFHLMIFDILTLGHNKKTLEHKVFIGLNGIWVAHSLYSLITYKSTMSIYTYEYIVDHHWFISMFPSFFDFLYASILFMFSFIARVDRQSILKILIAVYGAQWFKYIILRIFLNYNSYFWDVFTFTICAHIVGVLNIISYLLIV